MTTGGRWIAAAIALGACILSACAEAPAGAAATASPFVLLYDTGKPADSGQKALRAEVVAKKAGWTLVPEGKLDHKFAGDVVFANDKLAVVFRKGSPGAEVYVVAAETPAPRAVLTPLGRMNDDTATLTEVRAVENRNAAVTVEASFRTAAGKTARASFRLTTGEITLETRGGEGMAALLVGCQVLYAVVPEFFSDDVVAGVSGPLPVENQALNLVEGGDAIVMCIWKSNRRSVDALPRDPRAEGAVRGCRIEAAKEGSVWTGFLEARGIWHAEPLGSGDTQTDRVLGWKPPFPAKWRASIARNDDQVHSWYFRDGRQASYPSPWWGGIVYPCWFDSGRAMLRAPATPTGRPNHPRTVYIYPLDRGAKTPLTAFCPIDIQRSALGVGACQYLLDVEGLGAEGDATPDVVAEWVHKQFERKREERSAGQIRERLAAMVAHVGRVQERIGAYGGVAKELAQLWAEAKKDPGAARAAAQVGALADEISRIANLAQRATGETGSKAVPFLAKHATQAKKLSDEIVALIGKESPADRCGVLCEQIREVGDIQQQALARCRQAVRRARLCCRTMPESAGPQAFEFAKKVQALAERVLFGMVN